MKDIEKRNKTVMSGKIIIIIAVFFPPQINLRFHKMLGKVSADLIVSSPAYGGEQKALGQSG